MYAAASPAQSKASESARANGVPYGKLITTTPSTLDDPAGKHCFDMINKAVKFSEKWYDMPIEQVKQIVFDSQNKFVHVQYSYTELGRDEAWYKDQCKELNQDLFKIKRELDIQWMYASNDSPFSEEQLDIISQHVVKPREQIVLFGKYVFNVLTELKNIRNKSWVVAIDIATGVSLDYSAITVIDPLTCKPVITFRHNSVEIPDLVVIVEEFVSKYLPNAVIVPERNSVGIPFISLLLRTSVGKQVYYEVKTKKAEKVVEDPRKSGINNKMTYKKESRVYGIATTNDNRSIMTEDILFDVVNNTPQWIISEDIFNEIKTLVRDKKRIDHRPGCHDDQLMSYLIGLHAIFYGENINRFVKVTSDDAFASRSETNKNTDANRIRKYNNLNNNMYKHKKGFDAANDMIARYNRMEKEEDEEYVDLNPIPESMMTRKGKNSKKSVSKSTLKMILGMNKNN